TYGRAHRLLADARAVVAHVALHHDLAILVQLGHAERARGDAVAAGNAARLPRRLNDAVAGPLDRVGGTGFRAGRLLAVHAHHRHRLHAVGAIDVLEMDHRIAAVRVALGARLHTRLAPDAAAGINEEVKIVGLGHEVTAAARAPPRTAARRLLSAPGSR